MTEQKTQKQRLLESLARKEQAEKEHQALCKEILAAIEAKEGDGSLDDDGSVESMHIRMKLDDGAEGDPFIKFPIEVTAIDGKSDLWSDGWRHKANEIVAIRPCAEQYGGKTFLGVYLGDIALSATVEYHRESGVLRYRPSFHNPAIYIPDLQKIVFGCESWWGSIKSEEHLKQITDDDINNVWYVRALKAINERLVEGAPAAKAEKAD